MTLSDYYADGTLDSALTQENRLLFDDWYHEWLNGDYRPSTIQSELSCIKTWMEYCQSRDIDVKSASESDIKKYLRRRQSTLSDSALSSTATAIRKWHEWLVETSVRDDDPTAHIALDQMFNTYNPGLSQRQAALNEDSAPDELTTITPKIVDEMAKYCGAPRTRNELLIRLGFQTAMRPSEIARAKVENIDWDARSIYVKTSKAEPDHPYFQRYVFWHQDLDSLMYRWIGGPDGGGEREAYNVHKDSETIFLTRKKPEMRSEYVSRIVREAAQRAGVQQELGVTARQVPQDRDDDEKDGVPLYQISGHELRRASITHYANNVDVLNLHEIQAIAGHKLILQTREYVHDDWDKLKRKMRRVSF